MFLRRIMYKFGKKASKMQDVHERFNIEQALKIVKE
jgi:hypothetical protein